MTDKEMIAEMAKVIDDRLLEARNCLGSMNKGEGYWIAQKLVEHYQPKIPEGSIVISREEYKKLYNDERASYYRAENLAIENDLLNRKLIDAISEFNALQHKYDDICDKYRLCKDANETIKRRFVTARKETAREFASKVKESKEIKEFAEWYTISYVELCKAIDKIAKQFGVEVE